MIEGWHGDDYLVLFTDDEVGLASERYGISKLLPGYQVVGLRGWDDFIVQDAKGVLFTVPTVPCIPKDLEPYALAASTPITPDERFTGKIKWYVTPLAFGGDPESDKNIAWIDHTVHGASVTWWNALYRDLTQPLHSPPALES